MRAVAAILILSLCLWHVVGTIIVRLAGVL